MGPPIGGSDAGNGHPLPKGRRRRKWALTDKELEAIAVYRYKPGAYTFIDNLLTPYWNWAVTLLPSWMAPNLVTFLGLLGVSAITTIVLLRAPDLQTPLPSWLVIGYAVALFLYQTLDAIDGKQARRTNSSSPLGQLFDHGCDALVVLLCLVTVAATMRLGATWKTMLLFCNIELAFYSAQWEEYHTGTLNWSGTGWFGVTESQLTQMLLFIITGVFGAEVWYQPLTAVIPLAALDHEGWTILNFLLLVFTIVTCTMFAMSVVAIAPATAAALPLDERGDKTIGLAPALLQLVPFGCVMALAFLLATGPGAPLFARHPAAQLLGMGVTATHLISRMIVHHMAKTPLLLHDLQMPGLIALAGAALNLYWPTLGLGDKSPLPLDVTLLAAIAVSTAAYAWFIVGSVRDMCAFLGIRCFHLSPRGGGGSGGGGSSGGRKALAKDQ